MKNMRDETLAFYKDVLGSVFIKVDDKGKATAVRPDGTETQSVVNDKPLYIPQAGTLDGQVIDKIQLFHPLCEALSRKTLSPVMTYTQAVAKSNIGVYLKIILEKLMEVAATPELHGDLPPEATEYLTKLQQPKDQTVKKLRNLINKAIRQNCFVTIYSKNGGKYKGEKVSRLCTIRFPIIDMVDKDDTKSLKISFSSDRERKTIQALLHYVLPMGDNPEEYSAASNSKVAPYLEAFLLAYEKVAKQLNKILDRHGDSIDFQLEKFPTKVFKSMEKMGELYNNCRIPSLDGNEGGIKEMEAVKEAVSANPPPPNPGARATPRTPDITSSHQPKKKAGLSVDEYLNSINNYQQPQQPQQNMGYNMGYQQPMNNMGYQQPMQNMGYQQPQQMGGPFDVLAQNNMQYQQPMNNNMGYQQPMNNNMGYQQPMQQNMGYQQPMNNTGDYL